MVAMLGKNGNDIIAQMTRNKAEAWHYSSALCGEAGELFDAFKKHCVYGGPAPDYNNVVEELGDMMFFMQGLMNIYGITWEEVREGNMKKLAVRYKDYNFTDEQALNREDKK